MTSQPERRFLPAAPPAVKGRTVTGVAARFNSRSENLGSADSPLFEVISPGAFDGVLNDDIVAAYNHDESLILARSINGKGTLRLWVDDVGLNYEFTAPETTAGNDLLESLKRGDISSSSFAFSIAEGGDSFSQEPDLGILRTITKVARLYDVSPVVRPAYQATGVSARSQGQHEGTVPTPRADGWRKLLEILQ
jgi:uncharacterized protein